MALATDEPDTPNEPDAPDAPNAPDEPDEPVGRIVRLICAAPETIAIAVAGFSLPLMVLLLVGHLDWPLAYPLGVAGAAVAVAFGGRSPAPASRDIAKLTGVAAALLLCWFVANCFFSAQDLYAHRDPATYDLAGRWLIDHPSLRIPTRLSWFGTPAGYNDESAGFTDTAIGQVSAQGNHLLPVLLAAVGRLFGIAAMLRANLLFAALALFAFFGLARRIVGPRLALVAMSAFAVSLPVLYVSRDTFSEPLALLFLMAGLLLLHRAISHGRVRDYALAGFVAGSAAMVRIDAYAALLALIVVAAGLLAKAAPGQRAALGRRVAAMLAAGLVTTSMGWLDVSRLSYNYYAAQRSAILMLAKAGVAFVVLGAIVVLLVWRTGWRQRLASTEMLARFARWASAVVVLAFAFLASRPLWFVGHEQVTLLVVQIQKQAHHAVDSTRSYNEQTVSWQALYFGWPTVVLAVGGYVLLMRRMLLRRDWVLSGVLVMGLSMSALYLWSSDITPDQVWASRRYVTVVMPIMLVAAAYSLRVAHGNPRRWVRRAALGGAVLMVAYPLVATIPAITVREEVPQLAQVDAICAQVGKSGAVVEVDYNSIWGYQQTIRSYCNVPSLGLQDAQPIQLAAVRAALLKQGRQLYVLSTDVTKIQFVGGQVPPAFSTADTTRWKSSLNTLPHGPSHEDVSAYLGKIGPDGLAVPVASR